MVEGTRRKSFGIRDAVAGDEPAWRRLWAGYCAFYRAAMPDDVTNATWRRICDAASPMFARVVERNGTLAGFAVCVLHEASWTVAPVCYLEDLFVDPALRGGGFGGALIEDLQALAASRGWSRLYWHTEADNATARRLYDRLTPADGYVRYRLFLTPSLAPPDPPASAR